MNTLIEKAQAGSTNAQYELGLDLLSRGDPSGQEWLSRAAAKKHIGALEIIAYLDDRENFEKAASAADASDRLQCYMSWLSESCWCAGWLDGLEFDLWAALDGPGFPYGLRHVAPLELAVLRRLSNQCKGWYTWSDHTQNPTFVSLPAWQEIYVSKDQLGKK